MEKVLPKRWVEINLKESVDFRKGKKPKFLSEEYFEGAVPYMDIQGLERNIVSFYADSESAKYFKDNDVVIVWDGSRSGLILKPKSGAIGSTLGALSPYGYKSEFLYYFLLSQYEVINSKARGVGIPHVDPTYLWGLQLPLPPLPEQERIVAKLDKLFAQHEKIKQALDRIPQLLKTFRQQVLTQAVTGKLTEQWREGKELEEWKEEKLENVTVSISDGDHQAPPKSDMGIPFLVISDVSSGKLDVNKSKRFVPVHYYDNLKENRKPRLNDILYTVTGSFGIPIIVDTEKPFCFQRHIGILRPDNSKIRYEFLFYFLKSNLAYSQAIDSATGTAQLTVSLGSLRNFKISIPPLQEQKEIVHQVETLLAKADTIEARYQTLKAKIDNLPQALLHKAFKGELVPQLPTDGDAKDLLAEIMELRKSTEGKRGKL